MTKPRIKRTQTTVKVFFPEYTELTKRTSENSIAIEVRFGDDYRGKLLMGRGSVEWWPKGNRINSAKKDWHSFVKILEEQMK